MMQTRVGVRSDSRKEVSFPECTAPYSDGQIECSQERNGGKMTRGRRGNRWAVCGRLVDLEWAVQGVSDESLHL